MVKARAIVSTAKLAGAPAEVTPRMTIKKERQDGLDNGAGKEIVMTWGSNRHSRSR